MTPHCLLSFETMWQNNTAVALLQEGAGHMREGSNKTLFRSQPSSQQNACMLTRRTRLMIWCRYPDAMVEMLPSFEGGTNSDACSSGMASGVWGSGGGGGGGAATAASKAGRQVGQKRVRCYVVSARGIFFQLRLLQK